MKTYKLLIGSALMFVGYIGFSQTSGITPGAGAQNINGAAISYLTTNADPSVRVKNRIDEFAGSPYTDTNFKLTTLYYEDENKGDILYRYNAYNEEIEIKNDISSNAPITGLLKDKSISIRVEDDRQMSFKTFIDKENNTLNGYLILLHSGEKYNLYKRINVKYSEGSPAQNSFVKATPNRFSHFTEYFLEKKGENKIVELEPRKRKVLKSIDKEDKDIMEDYISDNDINVKDEEDLVKAFKNYNKA